METKYITLENALKAVNDRIEELEKKHGPLRPSTKIGIWGVKYYLLDIPTEDVAPIVRGKWLNVSKVVRDDYLGDVNYAECSVCHSIRVADYFCSCCGADMRKMKESRETQ